MHCNLCGGRKSGARAGNCARSNARRSSEVSMSIDNIKTVAVLGAGTMGNGIAHVFARSGYNVILRDVETRFLDQAMDTIAKNLDREVHKGKIDEGDPPKVLGRIHAPTDMSAIARADFAIEAVPERLDLKLAVLQETDKLLRP